eukprot:COSAG02_NODE_70848_length_193_cov_75.861702_1_plen_42_part_10
MRQITDQKSKTRETGKKQRAFVLRIYRTRGARPFMVIDPFPV